MIKQTRTWSGIPKIVYCEKCWIPAIFEEQFGIKKSKYDYSDKTRTPKLIICSQCRNTNRDPIPLSEIL